MLLYCRVIYPPSIHPLPAPRVDEQTEGTSSLSFVIDTADTMGYAVNGANLVGSQFDMPTLMVNLADMPTTVLGTVPKDGLIDEPTVLIDLEAMTPRVGLFVQLVDGDLHICMVFSDAPGTDRKTTYQRLHDCAVGVMPQPYQLVAPRPGLGISTHVTNALNNHPSMKGSDLGGLEMVFHAPWMSFYPNQVVQGIQQLLDALYEQGWDAWVLALKLNGEVITGADLYA